MWVKTVESHRQLALIIVQIQTCGLCNSSPKVTTQYGGESTGHRWVRGRLIVREWFPLFQHNTKPIDFSLCWGRRRGIFCFSVHHTTTRPKPGSGLPEPRRWTPVSSPWHAFCIMCHKALIIPSFLLLPRAGKQAQAIIVCMYSCYVCYKNISWISRHMLIKLSETYNHMHI